MSEVTIRKVANRVRERMRESASTGGKYARGLASEGYNGGYYQALQDVLLFMSGVRPNRHSWWQEEHYLDEKIRKRGRDNGLT
jgi:hypothetical protein